MAGLNKAAVKEEFDNKILRLTKSRAYLDYCEEVYGYRTYLFNMMDKQQLDFVLHSIPISSGDTVVDMGCGSGSVLSLLAAKYNCLGIGVDQLEEEMLGENSKAIRYIKGDIDAFAEYGLNPTVTLCIDSLYFSSDPAALLRQLNSVKSNRLYLFYSQYLFDETTADRQLLKGRNTQIGAILLKSGVEFSTVDFSDNERLFYGNSVIALDKYKDAFEKEGNGDLYQSKRREDMLGMELYKKRLASRYLYITESI